MKEVIIYTDGACSCNPGPGGWGAMLLHKSTKKEISGFEAHTTNNKMELTAVVKGLELLKEPCKVNLYSDSAYVVNAFLQGWVEKWKKNKYRNSEKKQIANYELWLKLINLSEYHKIVWNKVKGHADNEFNNRCDALARGEVDKYLSQQ